MWSAFQFFGHGFGVNSVSWHPTNFITHTSSDNSTTFGSVLSDTPPLRFVSCGMDNLIRVWQSRDNSIKSFYVTATLEGHEDFVRDVAWRPNSNSSNSNLETIASAGDVR